VPLLLLLAAPFLPHPKAQPIAQVSPANCNGCSRCVADCPYAAVMMLPHPDKPGHKLARVQGFNHARESIVQIKPAHIVVIDFNPDKGGIFFSSPS